MSNKIEFIEVNGRSYNVAVFGDDVKNLVSVYEETRNQHNAAAIRTNALEHYMNALGQEIQQKAVATLNEMLNPAVDDGRPDSSEQDMEDVVIGDSVAASAE